MKSNELRIDNVVCRIGKNTEVHLPETLIPFKIQSLSKFVATVVLYSENPALVEHHKEIKLFDLSPISISEEWLIKLGLERKSYKGEFVWVTKHYMFTNPEFGWYFKYKSDGFISFYFGNLFVRECRFVHQLQNFYFALTSDELLIN